MNVPYVSRPMRSTVARVVRTLLALLALAGPVTALAQGIARDREPGTEMAGEGLSIARAERHQASAAVRAERTRQDQRGPRATIARRSADHATPRPLALLAPGTLARRVARASYAEHGLAIVRHASAPALARPSRAPPIG